MLLRPQDGIRTCTQGEQKKFCIRSRIPLAAQVSEQPVSHAQKNMLPKARNLIKIVIIVMVIFIVNTQLGRQQACHLLISTR